MPEEGTWSSYVDCDQMCVLGALQKLIAMHIHGFFSFNTQPGTVINCGVLGAL